MITGSVQNNLDPVLQLSLHGAMGIDLIISFVVDTGFNGALSLPSHLVAALSLIHVGSLPITLADGTVVLSPLYQASVDWDGQQRNIIVTELEEDPLLGTEMLFGHDLFISFVSGGSLTIQRKS